MLITPIDYVATGPRHIRNPLKPELVAREPKTKDPATAVVKP